jgi:hypothetical protein
MEGFAAGACCAERGTVRKSTTIAQQQYNTARFITRSAPLRWDCATGDNSSDMRHYTHLLRAADSEILIPPI